MNTVRFSADHLRLACRSANRPFDRIMVRAGRFNGLYVWLTNDQLFERSASRHLSKKN